MEVIFQLLIVLGCLNVLSKNKPQQSQAHLQVAPADPRPKLAKELAFPNARTDGKNVAKMKDRLTEDKNGQLVTKAIKNRRISSCIRVCSPFELHRNLKNCASKSPTFS